MGVGPLDASSGIDVWLRVVHAVRATAPDVSALWLRAEGEPADERFLDAITHERWHLGLDDVIEFVEPQRRDALAVAPTATATVVTVTQRPPVGGGAVDSGSWATAVTFARAAGAKVVGFRGAGAPAPDAREGVEVELIDYPDAAALAAASTAALGVAGPLVTRR